MFIRPFSLMRKGQRIKADIIGPNAQSGRFPAMSALPPRPTQSVFGKPSLEALLLLHFIHPPLPSSRTSPFQRGCPKGGGLRFRDLSRPWNTLLSSLRVIASEAPQSIYDRFMEDLFPKNIHFHFQYFTRQPTTASSASTTRCIISVPR